MYRFHDLLSAGYYISSSSYKCLSDVYVHICVCMRMHEHAQLLSHIWLFAIQWTIACQSPLSVKFFRQEYWSELPFSSPGYLRGPGIESASLALHAGYLLLSHLILRDKIWKEWKMMSTRLIFLFTLSAFSLYVFALNRKFKITI